MTLVMTKTINIWYMIAWLAVFELIFEIYLCESGHNTNLKSLQTLRVNTPHRAPSGIEMSFSFRCPGRASELDIHVVHWYCGTVTRIYILFIVKSSENLKQRMKIQTSRVLTLQSLFTTNKKHKAGIAYAVLYRILSTEFRCLYWVRTFTLTSLIEILVVVTRINPFVSTIAL